MGIFPHYARIIEDWAEELAEVLGRPAAEILTKGLGAADFPNQEIQISFDDDSQAHFKYAFFIESQAKKAVAVFTEHCGYFIFPIDGMNITTLTKDYF